MSPVSLIQLRACDIWACSVWGPGSSCAQRPYLNDVYTIFGILDPPHLVCILASSLVTNPRNGNMEYNVCICVAPSKCRRHLRMAPNIVQYITLKSFLPRPRNCDREVRTRVFFFSPRFKTSAKKGSGRVLPTLRAFLVLTDCRSEYQV